MRLSDQQTPNSSIWRKLLKRFEIMLKIIAAIMFLMLNIADFVLWYQQIPITIGIVWWNALISIAMAVTWAGSLTYLYNKK